MKTVQAGFGQNFGLVGKNIRKYMATTALTATSLLAIASPAMADSSWSDLDIVTGSATTTTPSLNQTDILQTTDFVKAQGNATIYDGDTVNLSQPTASSIFAVYDITSDPTQILGSLNANGRVYIFDQNGVIFGKNSQVNVGSVLASTGRISDENMKNGKLSVEDVGTTGEVVNFGTITVAQAGLAGFVAPQVSNAGIINAKMGNVVLASGEKVTLDLYGDNLVNVTVDGALEKALVKNSGAIKAEGGNVVISAQAAKNAVDNVINMDGVVDVSSVSVQGGKIVLSGGNKGVVNVSGKVKADGKDGGSVKVTGQNILVSDTAEISANAVTAGNGGRVDMIANEGLVYGGNTQAKGGALSGNGGYVDTSGKGWVDIYGTVDASATNGQNGTWLIDPSNLTITGAINTNVGGNGSSGSPFAPDGDFLSFLRNTSIEAALNAGNDVYITTVGTPDKFGQDGLIFVNANITKTSGAASTLFIDAAGGIITNAGKAISATAGNILNVAMTAVKSIFVGGAINTNGGNVDLTSYEGNINVRNTGSISTNGGNVTFRANDPTIDIEFFGPASGNIALNGVVDAAGGNIDMHQSAVFFSGDNMVRTSGTGTVRLNQNRIGDNGFIQTTIDAVQNTGTGTNTVDVGAGTYNESVLVNKDNFILRGANAGNTGAGGYGSRGAETIVDPNSPGFYVTGDNTVIDGFTVTGTSGLDGEGIWVDGADNAKIINNIIYGTSQNGILFKNTTGGGYIAGNAIDDTGHNGIAIYNGGGTFTIENNAIGLHGESHVFGNGIYANSIVGGQIRANEIANTVQDEPEGNDASGVYLVGTTGVLVGGNTNADANNIHDVDWDGVKVEGGTANVVRRNVISNTTRVGVWGYLTDSLRVLSNTITGTHVTAGIGSEGGNKVEITGNTVTDTLGDGISVRDTTGYNQVRDNIIGSATGATDIVGNGVALYNISGALVDNNTIRHTKTVVYDGAHGSGVYSINGTDNRITRNLIRFADWDGVKVDMGYNNYVGNNNIAHSTRVGVWGINTDTIEIDNNTIDDSNITAGIGVYYSKNINIHDNNVNDSVEDGIGVHDSQGTVTIANNTVTNSTDDGIEAKYINGDVDIIGNIVQNAGFGPIFDGSTGNGIVVDGVLNGSVSIINNGIDPIADNGIYVNNFLAANIYGNTTDDVGGNGILVTDGGYVNISNNRDLLGDGVGIYNSGKNGIFVDYVSGSNITSNTVDYSGWDGIHVSNFDYTYIALNTVSRSGDDGIEAHDGNSVEIDNNTISQSGLGVIIVDEEPEDYESYDEFFGGADGIHVRNIHGKVVELEDEEYDDEVYSAKIALIPETGYGYAPGIVRITNNNVDVSGDDGIEAVNVEGYVYIAGNTVDHSGVGGTGYVYDDADIYGADGIHVRDAYLYPYGYSYEVDNHYRLGDYGNGEYNVVVANNTVSNSLDDGVEILGTGGFEMLPVLRVVDEDYEDDYEDEEGSHYEGTYGEYEGYYEYPYGSTGRVLVLGNTITNSGYGDPSQGYGLSGYYYSGGDGIHVQDVYAFGEIYAEAGESESGFYGYAVDILDNTVTNSGDDGIDVELSSSTLIDNNTVTNSGWVSDDEDDVVEETFTKVIGSGTGADYYGADGIFVNNVGFYGEGPIWTPKSVESAGFSGDGFKAYSVVIRRNTVDNSLDDGIQVKNDFAILAGRSELFDFPFYGFGAPVLIGGNNEGDGNTVTNSGNHGLFISGPGHNDVIVSGNTFAGFDIGSEFESGTIDLTGASNSYDNGRVGFRFAPYNFGGEIPSFAFLSLVDDDAPGVDPYVPGVAPTNFGGTIGAQIFTNISQFYIELDNGAFFEPGTPTWLNGLNSSYDGIVPAADADGILDQATYDTLEAKIFHYIDRNDLGLFFFGLREGDPLINQNLIFNRFNAFNGDLTGLNVTILGLPNIPGQGAPVNFNNITPAAGGTSPADLNNISTAAGGDEGANPGTLNDINTAAGGSNEACWSNAVNAAGNGQVVNVVYNGSFDDNLTQAAACGGAF